MLIRGIGRKPFGESTTTSGAAKTVEKHGFAIMKTPNDKQANTLGKDGKPKKTYAGFNDRWNASKPTKGKNPGDVLRINPRPFPRLISRCFRWICLSLS